MSWTCEWFIYQKLMKFSTSMGIFALTRCFANSFSDGNNISIPCPPDLYLSNLCQTMVFKISTLLFSPHDEYNFLHHQGSRTEQPNQLRWNPNLEQRYQCKKEQLPRNESFWRIKRIPPVLILENWWNISILLSWLKPPWSCITIVPGRICLMVS